MHHYYPDVAWHYQQYRPPLHAAILEKWVGEKRYFLRGLDVGCGTGASSIALSTYCESVVGVDPSTEMLLLAAPHPRVSYQPLAPGNLPFPRQSFEVITFAGAWYYAQSQEMLAEVIRVGKPGATILLYDFELTLGPVFEHLGIARKEENDPYDHEANFDGLLTAGLEKTFQGRAKASLTLSPKQWKHVLMAEMLLHAGKDAPDLLEGEGGQRQLEAWPQPLEAQLYASRYRRV